MDLIFALIWTPCVLMTALFFGRHRIYPNGKPILLLLYGFAFGVWFSVFMFILIDSNTDQAPDVAPKAHVETIYIV